MDDRRRLHPVLIGGTLLLLITGFFRFSEWATEPGPAETGPARRVATSGSFDYQPGPMSASLELIEETPGYRTYHLILEENLRPADAISAFYSHPRNVPPSPLVILFPALGGRTGALSYFTTHLNRKGFACLRLERKERILIASQGLEHIREAIHREVVQASRLIDWAGTRQEVDPTRVAVLGVSMGALTASLVAATEERIGSAVLILGGGDLPRILLDSEKGTIRSFRTTLMRQNGWSRRELLTRARKTLREVDPLHYANGLDPERTMMVEAVFDQVIPASSRYVLWSRAGRPPRILLPLGHLSTVFLAPYIRWRVFHFLRSSLPPSPIRAGPTQAKAMAGTPIPVPSP